MLVISIVFTLLLGFVETTDELRIESPDGQHIVEVSRISSGALGGSTKIGFCRRNDTIKLLFGEIKKDPIPLYEGDWGAFDWINIVWKSDDAFMMNDIEVDINDLQE